MMRPLVLGITVFASLTLGGCFGEKRLTEGAAAGAGIGALLGLEAAADEQASSTPEEGSGGVPQLFGPVE